LVTPYQNGSLRMADYTETFADGGPCPFCASDDTLVWASHLTGPYVGAAPRIWCVFCNVCEAEGPHHDSREGAISSWNTRP